MVGIDIFIHVDTLCSLTDTLLQKCNSHQYLVLIDCNSCVGMSVFSITISADILFNLYRPSRIIPEVCFSLVNGCFQAANGQKQQPSVLFSDS